MKKAQVSLEYLILTAFVLVIVIIIFALALYNYDTNIKLTKAGNSLDSLVKTADLVYAKGPGTVLFATVNWPDGAQSIGILYKCKSDPGCSGLESTNYCDNNALCIKYSAVQLTMNDGTKLLYGSRARLCIKSGSSCLSSPASQDDFPLGGVENQVKVLWWATPGGIDFIELQGTTD